MPQYIPSDSLELSLAMTILDEIDMLAAVSVHAFASRVHLHSPFHSRPPGRDPTDKLFRDFFLK